MIHTQRPLRALPGPRAKPLTEADESAPGDAGADTSGARNESLAFLGHELRTPLSAALQGVKVLRLAVKDPTTASQALDLVERQLRSMTRLVDDVLDFSRAALGKGEVRRERVDLAQLVRTVAEDHRPVLDEGGLALGVETPSTPLWALADADRLAQVLNNLLDNCGGPDTRAWPPTPAESGCPSRRAAGTAS
jgi:signal transduction histidine kinase